MLLSDMQLYAYDCLLNSKGENMIIGINSPAGTGKTAFIEHCFNELSSDENDGIYLAFNRKIVNNVIERFSDMEVECDTFHSFAISNLEVEDVAEKYEYRERDEIIAFAKIKKFCLSKRTNYKKEFKGDKKTIKLFKKFIKGEITPTYEVVLKRLHMLLYKGKIRINTNILCVDECQDLSPVMIEITKLIKANYKIISGDMNQHIYSFLGAINAFEHIDCKIITFDKQFRMSEDVNQIVNKFVKERLETN